MSQGNTEIKSDAALPEPAADGTVSDMFSTASEVQEPTESDESVGETAAAASLAESKDLQTEFSKEEPEPILSSKEEERKKAHDEAYEKLYTDILEHFRSFSPAEQIAGKITEEHITEYLETNREERIQQYRERREKRLLAALELFAVLGTVIAIVNFLRSDPAILVNILYIIGALGAFFLWKHPRNKDDK